MVGQSSLERLIVIRVHAPEPNLCACSSIGRSSECDSERCEFESHHAPPWNLCRGSIFYK